MSDFFQKGINYYVPGALAATGIGNDDLYSVDIGLPITTSATAISTAGAITNVANAALAIASLPYEIAGTFGRNILVAGKTGGDNAVVTVSGEDYLGQPMRETFTLNGTSSVVGGKAFKRVTKIGIAAGNANASSTMDVGLGLKFGLPFCTHKLLAYSVDGADTAIPTLNAPSLTDPQTAATADARGTVTLATGDINGVKKNVLIGRVNRALNTAGNGGIYGLPHLA